MNGSSYSDGGSWHLWMRHSLHDGPLTARPAGQREGRQRERAGGDRGQRESRGRESRDGSHDEPPTAKDGFSSTGYPGVFCP